MNIPKKTMIAILAGLCIGGCAWNGEISPNFHKPFGINNDKVPITVGIIDDARFTPRDVEYGVSMSYSLKISNYLYGLKGQLEHHFQNVRIVNEMQACSECSLFAVSQTNVQLNQFSGTAFGDMEVLFLNKEGKNVTVLKTSRQTGGVLGTSMGTPSSYGQKITAAIERVLSLMLNDIGSQITNNPYLSRDAFTYSKSDTQNGKLKVDPKFMKFMSAVVVIKTPEGLGTGFFIDPKTIITNQHVVESWANVQVARYDGKTIIGHVDRVDRIRDLAIVKIKEASKNILELGNEKDVYIGEDVIAIGTPKGLDWTVTKGIVSQSRNDAGVVKLQTDVAINPGNSGGPLISTKSGKVVGINVSILRVSGGLPLEGLNFAVSVDELKEFLNQSK